MNKRAWKVGLAGLLAIGLTTRASAFLGIGDVVFDPSVYAQALQQVIQMGQQYVQLVQSYEMLRNQYNQLTWMARQVPVNMATRYRALATPWQPVTATDTYGLTSGWVTGINTGLHVTEGYLGAIENLGTYGNTFNDLPADQQAHVKTAYGTIELTDGANLNGMDALGRLRANAPATALAIQGLEDDSLSTNPDMNTEVAVLNKINAANVIAVRAGQDTNQLLVALAEHQIIDAARTRDAEARAINQDIRFRSQGHAMLTAQAAGASQAMLNWQMP